MSASFEKVLIFDLSGPFAHYKRIFATTTALTYPLPPKTSLYGLVAAILGLEKTGNDYLNSFPAGSCRMGIQLLAPLAFQRISMNLRPSFGSLRATENRKPTLMEFVDRPKYRIYFTHQDRKLYDRLKQLLENKQSAYTPTLGLANLIAQVDYVGEGDARPTAETDVDSVIPKSRMEELIPFVTGRRNRLMEVGQYAVEMLPSRDVTVRDSILLDRQQTPISARVTHLQEVTFNTESANVVFF
jgi:CRISPR-associated protein Cas5h